MATKIKIEKAYVCWKNINHVLFDLNITINEKIVLDGICIIDIRFNTYSLNERLIKQLTALNIKKEIIEFGLDTENYDFEYESISILENEKKIEFKEIILDKNFDYTWDEEENKIIENFPQMTFDFTA